MWRVGFIKVWRYLRRSPARAIMDFRQAFVSETQFLSLALAAFTSWIGLRTASLPKVIIEASAWADAMQAAIYVALGWAVICLIRAPLMVASADRAKAAWHGSKFIYYEPVLVGMSVFSVEDANRASQVNFNDAEPGSHIQYSISLDPPVQNRASTYVKKVPGQISGSSNNFHSDLPSGSVSQAKSGSRGSFQPQRVTGFLRVILDPATVQVTARVYMHSFDVGSG